MPLLYSWGVVNEEGLSSRCSTRLSRALTAVIRVQPRLVGLQIMAQRRRLCLHVGLCGDVVVDRAEDHRRHALGLAALDAGVLDRVGQRQPVAHTGGSSHDAEAALVQRHVRLGQRRVRLVKRRVRLLPAVEIVEYLPEQHIEAVEPPHACEGIV